MYQELWRVGCPPVQVFQPLRFYEIASFYFNYIDLLLIIISIWIFFHALLKKSHPPRGQHFQRSCGRPCWSTQWTNQCRGRSTLNWKNSIKIQFSLLLFYVIYIYFVTIGYFVLRAQIFKLFLSCCVPYVNFHCLQEKFVFFKVRPPPLKTEILFWLTQWQIHSI